jgi:hypothetical protein
MVAHFILREVLFRKSCYFSDIYFQISLAKDDYRTIVSFPSDYGNSV